MIFEKDRHSLAPTGMGLLLELSRVMIVLSMFSYVECDLLTVLVVTLGVSFVIGPLVLVMWGFCATLFGAGSDA